QHGRFGEILERSRNRAVSRHFSDVESLQLSVARIRLDSRELHNYSTHIERSGVMAVRIQVLLDPSERERFRRRAAQEGLSLSAWLRQAGREKVDSEESHRRMTHKELRAFFKKCDAREKTREPDWEQHRAVIRRSLSHGQSGT